MDYEAAGRAIYESLRNGARANTPWDQITERERAMFVGVAVAAHVAGSKGAAK